MNIFQKIFSALAVLIGKVNWKLKNPLSESEKDEINALLKADYYILLSRNNNHLSSYMIGLGDFLLTGKFGYWGHAFMNLEDTVTTNDDFRFVEAIGTGVQYATFDQTMAVNSIALLKPKSMKLEDWTAVLEKARTDIGKPYDTLFDLSQDQSLSCVELVRDVLMADDDYYTNFARFEAMCQKHKKITPQMFYDCPDFQVVLEIRH